MRTFGAIVLFLIVIVLSGLGYIYFSEGADAFSWETVHIHEEHTLEAADIQ